MKIYQKIFVVISATSILAQGSLAAETKSKKEPTVQNQKTGKYDPVTCAFPKDEASLKDLLSPEQFEITKRNGTEAPFKNAYWDNHHPGLYIDVISKEPLFSSKDKFDSGTGWPSFSKPVGKGIVKEKTDSSYGMKRIEVRSARADSHLGHIFDDGPKEAGGLRYCINSASLKFIPLEKMKEEGYEDWLKDFNEKDWAEAKKNPWKGK